MTPAFLELTLVLIIAATLGLIARLLRQPLILAYIFTGIFIGIFAFFRFGNPEFFRTFADLGIMFLLFMIGLEINWDSLRFVGRPALIVGLGQIIFTFLIGFLIALIFNFGYLISAYISIALTFSSTIIVVKLLSEKRDLRSLYGKITVGFLLVQDFLAILILIILAGIENGDSVFGGIPPTLMKGAALIFLMFWLGRRVLPMIFDRIARSEEMLFLGAIAWCLGVAAATIKLGFSVEIGGFLAGLALANTSERFHIAERIHSLRDFFILIFFVILGSSLVVSGFREIILPLIVFSLFVLIGNPLIVLIIMGVMGYRKRTSFLCGITVAQISEFSLILAALGLKLGHINQETVSLIIGVGIITITLSTYLIIHGEKLFRLMNRYLKTFERRAKNAENEIPPDFDKPLILVGGHRVGQNIAANLPKEKLLIIDFDPDIISKLRKEGYTCLFGDIIDREIFERANIKKCALLISTSPDFEDNLEILRETRQFSPRPKIILRAEDEEDALTLYSQGSDYVILPYLTSGQYLGRSISVDPELKILEQLKKKDMEVITQNKNHH